jgi:dTDP-4-dehydrorhamnose 3,5-epimerase
MTVEKLGIKGLLLITPVVQADNRGCFFEVFRQCTLRESGIEKELVQVNQSHSLKDVIRGLHFQKQPFEQGKLIRVTVGRIMDVAVDLRPGSDTFLKWQSVTLSGDIPQMFWIPGGFAHGFRVLSEYADVEYHCDEYYKKEFDGGILFSDDDIGIKWGLDKPIISDRDSLLPSASQLFGVRI